MKTTVTGAITPLSEVVPIELAELMEQVRALPDDFAKALMPAVAEAIEQARFRCRALGVAKEALQRLRLDLELTRFDRDLTKLECQARAG